MKLCAYKITYVIMKKKRRIKKTRETMSRNYYQSMFYQYMSRLSDEMSVTVSLFSKSCGTRDIIGNLYSSKFSSLYNVSCSIRQEDVYDIFLVTRFIQSRYIILERNHANCALSHSARHNQRMGCNTDRYYEVMASNARVLLEMTVKVNLILRKSWNETDKLTEAGRTSRILIPVNNLLNNMGYFIMNNKIKILGWVIAITTFIKSLATIGQVIDTSFFKEATYADFTTAALGQTLLYSACKFISGKFTNIIIGLVLAWVVIKAAQKSKSIHRRLSGMGVDPDEANVQADRYMNGGKKAFLFYTSTVSNIIKGSDIIKGSIMSALSVVGPFGMLITAFSYASSVVVEPFVRNMVCETTDLSISAVRLMHAVSGLTSSFIGKGIRNASTFMTNLTSRINNDKPEVALYKTIEDDNPTGGVAPFVNVGNNIVPVELSLFYFDVTKSPFNPNTNQIFENAKNWMKNKGYDIDKIRESYDQAYNNGGINQFYNKNANFFNDYKDAYFQHNPAQSGQKILFEKRAQQIQSEEDMRSYKNSENQKRQENNIMHDIENMNIVGAMSSALQMPQQALDSCLLAFKHRFTKGTPKQNAQTILVDTLVASVAVGILSYAYERKYVTDPLGNAGVASLKSRFDRMKKDEEMARTMTPTFIKKDSKFLEINSILDKMFVYHRRPGIIDRMQTGIRAMFRSTSSCNEKKCKCITGCDSGFCYICPKAKEHCKSIGKKVHTHGATGGLWVKCDPRQLSDKELGVIPAHNYTDKNTTTKQRKDRNHKNDSKHSKTKSFIKKKSTSRHVRGKSTKRHKQHASVRKNVSTKYKKTTHKGKKKQVTKK